MHPLILRWGFVILTTAVMVFFFEKAYWYPQGYAIGELILKLAVLLTAVYLPLHVQRRREPAGSLLPTLADLIRLILELTPPVQSVIGSGISLWAWVATIRPSWTSAVTSEVA